MRIYILLAAVGIFLLLAIIFYYNNRQKQRTNKVLEDTLGNLRSTQSQLIQSEKMASLGELTAGIAHEIQNPLNFVNNFSEVNDELLNELTTEADKGNLDEVKAIAKDIKFNLKK
jgi:C4-dicarboxylate-specific signal transduction histidine kinase